MNQDFDELVRDSMTRFTDGIDMPSRLVADARRQRRRRRRARIGWLASGAAVAGATAVAIGTFAAGTVPPHPGQHHSGHKVPVLTAAVVITHVERALATAASGNPVAYTRQTSHGFKLYLAIPHGKPTVVHGSVTNSWSRGPLRHVIVATKTGKPALSMVADTRSGNSVQTIISYPQRVWWRGTYDAPSTTKPAIGCELGAVDRTPAQWAREIRKLLSCGAAVAGRQRVDGVDTIRLKLSSSYRRACAGASDAGRCHPQDVGWSGTLWASAKTYLPVRLKSHGSHFSFQIDFNWLPPTAANLSKLHQPIPSGFRHV